MKLFFLLIVSYFYLFADAHIFVYHRFEDKRHFSTNTSIEHLKKQFEYFKNNNYKVVALSKIIYNINHHIPIPDNWVALTIDDGYKSFYQYGLPIFKQYNYPFSLYVYVEATKKHYGDYMNWDQIKEASKYGEIGLHSYSHPHLLNLTNQEIYQDTKKAYDIFVKNLGFKPKSYAYPYGEYNSKVQNVLKKFNFDAILNQSTGSINNLTDTQDIFRIALTGKVNLIDKLKYKTLQTTWIEPKYFPKSGVLKSIIAKVDPKIKKAKLYITGLGWSDIKVKNGIINQNINKYLPNSRTRIIIGRNYYHISTQIITKIKRKKNVKQHI
jgi:peptidoglycan/xylan/chitin deacetylase (PgdA/CDA1 family)